MSVRLVLGPSGARKVGRLLDAHEDASRAGRTAWLVVPGAGDVDPFRRELAGLAGPPGRPPRSGVPFGAVMTAARLSEQLLDRFGSGQTILSPDHRRAVALAAVHATGLKALEPAARSGWLAAELIRLAEELAITGDLGGPAERGLYGWSDRSSDARGRELADLLRADAAILARLARGTGGGQLDRAAAAAVVAHRLRADPAGAADLHVVFQGFDDLDPVQRALVIALGRSSAQVLVSLPFEPGREALAAASPLVEALRAEAGDGAVEQLAPSIEGRAPTELEQLAERLYEHQVYVAPPPAPVEDLLAQATAMPFELGPLVRYDADDEPGEVGVPAAPGRAGEPHDGTHASRDTDADAPADEPPPVDPDSAAVVELRGGGPDEEASLIAEHVARCVAAGVRAERIAIVVGRPAAQGPPLAAALERAGLPVHLVADRPARVWPSVAAILALLRAAGGEGEARHLVDWIAGPGGPGGAELFDATIRRRGATGVGDGLRVWASLGHERMVEVDELKAAVRLRERDRFERDRPDIDGNQRPDEATESGSLEAVVARLLRSRLGAAMRSMGLPTPDQERDLRAVGRVLAVLDGLVRLAADAPELGLGLKELTTLIEETPSPLDREPAQSVAVVDPLDVRTRYPEIVIVARAVRNAYPAPEPIRQVLTRADRTALRDRHGWPAASQPDHAARQRYLAYEVVARPTRQLALAWHAGNGDGKPVEPSPLIDEVRRVAVGPVPAVDLASGAASRRALAAGRRALLDAARGGPRHRERTPERSALLAEQVRDRFAVGELQAASRCAAQWFVQHHLRPAPLSPDAAPLTAGRLRHELLADIVRRTVVGDDVPLGPAAVPLLRAALAEAAARQAAEARNETQAERLMRERVVAEVDATIPGLCGDRRLAHQPIEFELPFGTTPRGGAEEGVVPGDDAVNDRADDDRADDARPPVTVDRAGERLVLAGRIDRLDHDAGTGELVVVDYKGANVDAFKAAGWVEGRELQAGLYALAAEALVGDGSRTVASLYQPVPGPANQPPRGATSTELAGRSGILRNDRLSPQDWDELLDALVRLAAEAQRSIEAGVIAAEPRRCSPGGCRYPWLCREVQA